MSRFNYLLEKIMDAKPTENPFQLVYIEDFLNTEDLEEVLHSREIFIERQNTTRELVQEILNNRGYCLRRFPGAVQDVDLYLEYLQTGIPKHSPLVYQDKLSGYGLVATLKSPTTNVIQELVDFSNSNNFFYSVANKLGISTEDLYHESYIQKYLKGYELAPHPDSRVKAATYMLNLNNSINNSIHTNYMVFKPEYEWVESWWDHHPEAERVVVPWSWCTTCWTQTKNNSIVLFKTSNRSLHSVKLDYDHLNHQRTQLYGNLWDRSMMMTPLKNIFPHH